MRWSWMIGAWAWAGTAGASAEVSRVAARPSDRTMRCAALVAALACLLNMANLQAPRRVARDYAMDSSGGLGVWPVIAARTPSVATGGRAPGGSAADARGAPPGQATPSQEAWASSISTVTLVAA